MTNLYDRCFPSDSDADEVEKEKKEMINSLITFRMLQRTTPKPTELGQNTNNMIFRLNAMRQNSTTGLDFKHLELSTDRLTAKAAQRQKTASLQSVKRRSFSMMTYPMALQDRYLDELGTLQEVFEDILKKHSTSLKSDDNQLVIYPCILRARVATDFPETKLGYNRFITRKHTLDIAKKCLTLVKEKLYLSQMNSTVRAYFLLADASYHFRKAQWHYNTKKIESCKEDFCDAIVYLDHISFLEEWDINGMSQDIGYLKSLLTKSQRGLFKLESG